ncbi:hypothetical protein ERK19_04995 [Lactobacillus helsingborgensis]|uniref:hypothetical protein n=1 Tax=Lactobacillus helsingborgensis TaxID=1218494 RepID=UPI00164F70C0|nr:hypothetical protein [Lactobacillus helsingborgensis]MBC6356707.1 hypothetical protein [Lactobacillus helsingborgensis]
MSYTTLEKIEIIYEMYQKGYLGDKTLPEDTNPNLDTQSEENAVYFTLPMALNYQRNSYTLWESAKKTFEDSQTKFLFYPKKVISTDYVDIQKALTKHRLAIQVNKQTDIWIRLCKTFCELSNGSVIAFISNLDNDVDKIRNFMQGKAKKKFPYLSGKKLCNYWLFVLTNYTQIPLKNISDIYIAADRHIIRASYKLGLITKEQEESSRAQDLVIQAWTKVLKDSKYNPIDLQNPIWLWSRNDFKALQSFDNMKIEKNIE